MIHAIASLLILTGAPSAPAPGHRTEESVIINPIIPGFHPDPSICRAGDDYYIATSTFQWFGGVQIHHSRDLIHWRPVGQALTRKSQLDMRGVRDSGGVWAPGLSYSPPMEDRPGTFWIVYTNVRTFLGPLRDHPNYLVTAESIEGPWSEPIFLNASGYDPSLFHDDDGRVWLLNQLWDHRPGRRSFAGIVIQEYDPDAERLVGDVHHIFDGTELGITEGPHLHKHDGWYYLLTAEGGTFWNHAVTVARSREITGPYELHPENPILTSRDRPHLELQKVGHASLVETPGGTYLAHLTGRPVGEQRRCMLGRESALQKIEWGDDGWPRLAHGTSEPRVRVPGPGLPLHPFPPEPARDEFDSSELGPRYQTLRVPADESWLSLTERPGWLRLRGRESLSSHFEQSLVGRRVQAFHTRAQTRVDFDPEHFQQSAGLLAYYDTRTWYYLEVTHDEDHGRVLVLSENDDDSYAHLLDAPVPIGTWGEVHLRATIDHADLRFEASPDGEAWTRIGPVLDATRLSDDYGTGWDHFTGAFYALAAQDLSGAKRQADFAYFEYVEKPSTENPNAE